MYYGKKRDILVLRDLVVAIFARNFYLFIGCQLYRSHDFVIFCKRSYSRMTLLSARKAVGRNEDIAISSQRLARLIATYACPQANIVSSSSRQIEGNVSPCVLCTVRAKAFCIGYCSRNAGAPVT